MDYARKTLGEQISHGFRVGDIDAMKIESAMRLQIVQPGLLERGIVVVVQVVAADDFMPLLQQAEADVHADETCATGDENLQAIHLN